MLWHYTTCERWQKIKTSGTIRRETLTVTSRERPAVWFSLSERWDPAEDEHYRDSRGNTWTLKEDEAAALAGGLVRIGVSPEVAPYDWKQYKLLSGIEDKQAKRLYSRALGRGIQPADWRVSFDDVPRERWDIVEFFTGSAWSDDESALPPAPSDEYREEVIRQITSRKPTWSAT